MVVSTSVSEGARTTRLDLWAIVPAAFFAVTAAVGAVRFFSPVPFWDMWDGTVLFHFERKLRGVSTFFEQANEHRILWSRILFWADYKFFGALNRLTVATNLVLMAALWIALASAARQLAGPNRRAGFLAAMLVALPCFSWLQYENITWGYQSQFFLAYLLPLLAFMCMTRWMREGREAWYVGAVALAVASSVAMANGLLALPLLIVMLLVNGRFGWRRLLLLGSVTAALFALWFHGYSFRSHPVAPLSAQAQLILTFLGAPGHFLFRSEVLGFGLGAAVIASCAYFVWAWAAGRTRDPLYSGLVLFLVYVCAAGAAVARGRAFDDYHMTLTSRYETPVLLAYAAIALMYMHLGRHRVATPAVLATVLVCSTVILVETQMTAVGPTGPQQVAQRMHAALALNLGVRDSETTKAIYPADEPAQVTNVLQRGQMARDANLGVFALPALQATRSAIGKTPEALGLVPCEGKVDLTYDVAADPKFQRISGWTFDAARQSVPSAAFIVANGVVVGVGLTGRERPDVERAKPLAVRAGFGGYMWTRTTDARMYCAK